jgi:hypothetical protein
MSTNNMNQYKANVQNLVSNKLQELHDTTATWKDNYERAIKQVYEKQGNSFNAPATTLKSVRMKKQSEFIPNKKINSKSKRKR